MWYPLPKETTESDHNLFTNTLHSPVTVPTTYYSLCELAQLHYQESMCNKITKLRWSINPFKCGKVQISGMTKNQNGMHEEI